MKPPIRSVLYSPAYLRQVSNLVIFFACANLILGLVDIAFARGNPERLDGGIGAVLAGLLLIALAVWMRRGSRVALWVFVAVLLLDVVGALVLPMGFGGGWGLATPVIVCVILITQLQRRRAAMQA